MNKLIALQTEASMIRIVQNVDLAKKGLNANFTGFIF